jgi:hypothetical protein
MLQRLHCNIHATNASLCFLSDAYYSATDSVSRLSIQHYAVCPSHNTRNPEN